MVGYVVAAPDEYLAITGMGISDDIKITKSAWVLPFQKCMRFSVQPHDYAMNLQAMTKEKLQFLLPVVFTVGPRVPAPGSSDMEISADAPDPNSNVGAALLRYAVLLAEANYGSKTANTINFLEQKIKSIVEGEVRVLVSSITMEEIFTERDMFKRQIHRNIQTELDQFGLKIYNANVKELRDAPNSVYFESLSRKAHEGATNQARIDVSDAQLRGNVGEADRRGRQEREIAKIHADTAVQKTERDIERAQAEARLNTKRTELSRDVDISKVEATRALEARDEDLKRDVEVKRREAELERLRAKDVVKATIEREAKQQSADAKAYEVEADAHALYTKSQREADAAAYHLRTETMAQADAVAYKTKTEADATLYAAEKNAEAELLKKLKEAEGVSAMADAYGQLAQAFGGPRGLLQYMMLEKNTYVELARANATALHGMQPKISIWNTGAEAGSSSDSKANGVEVMRNMYQMLPPLMTTIHDQTGITLPEWQFGHMAVATKEVGKGMNGQV